MKKRIKIASASLSQIVYDYGTNFRHFCAAIDLAVQDGADILATPELSGTGYEADDYHQWNHDNENVWTLLMAIARYAEEKDPNLVVTVGVPWHYADKTKPASDPEYNINNRPFNTHVTITGGRVEAMEAKTILADGAAEYEPRQFNSWAKGTIPMTLPDGSVVPFGKPVIHLGTKGGFISLKIEICADGWPGVHDDLTVDDKEQCEARYIAELSKQRTLSVVLNPSASKPEPSINKENIREKGLCETGSRYAGVYVYTNYLGSASGTYAAEGSQIFAQDGEVIHHGRRYSFSPVSYSSATVDVPTDPVSGVDAVCVHDFQDNRSLEFIGGEADFDHAHFIGALSDEQLVHEENMRTISLWLHDHLSKPNWSPQGYLVSLSGGKDSAYGALAVATMIELGVKENGVEGFFNQFKGLDYRDEVLAVFTAQGEEAAINFIKYHMLTCVYMPTETSSARTLNAARFLIEGGTLPDDRKVKGIGGKFVVAPMQAALEELIAGHVGLDLDKIAATHTDEILNDDYKMLSQNDRHILARGHLRQAVNNYVNAPMGSSPTLPDHITKYCFLPMPTWSDPKYDLVLQGFHSRVRTSAPWAIAAHPLERKIALVTSNASESDLGYTCPGGDEHMGFLNPVGGTWKHDVTNGLLYIEKHGITGLSPAESLHWINQEKPSAELRKEVDGQEQQTDEGDLGFSYAQAAVLGDELLIQRKNPAPVLNEVRRNKIFPTAIIALRDMIIGFTQRWERGHGKRIMAPLAPHMRNNPDPHQSIRTTLLGDHFRTGCAHMTLAVLEELAGGKDAFTRQFYYTPKQAKIVATLNPAFKSALVSWPVKILSDPRSWERFEEENRRLLSYAAPANQGFTPGRTTAPTPLHMMRQ